MRVPKHATVVSYLALFVALGGTAYAATGDDLVLGHANHANTSTSLKNSGSGPALKLTTRNSRIAPFAVSNGSKITHLNADEVDGLSSEAFQRKSTDVLATATAVNTKPAGSLGPWTFSLVCNSNFALLMVNGSGSVGGTESDGGDNADAQTRVVALHPIGGGYQAGFASTDRQADMTLFLRLGSRFALAELLLMATNDGQVEHCKVVGAASLIS